MKKVSTVFYLLLAISVGLFACGATARDPEVMQKNDDSITSNKFLIVYLSRTNNTKTVAEIIQSKIGGDLIALELVDPYPENYKDIVEQVVRENESGFLPPLKTKINNFDSYTHIFIGFPTWGMKLPPPIKSFLNDYNLQGRNVIPFNTNAGYGIGSSFETVKQLCKNCVIKEGFTTKGGIERDGIKLAIKDRRLAEVALEVDKWLEKIQISSGTMPKKAIKN